MLHSGQWKLIFCLVETVYFCSGLIFCCLKLEVTNSKKKKIFLLVKTIFFNFLPRISRFFVQWKRISQRILRSGYWKLFSRLYKTFFIYFSETSASESFFPSSRNVFLNESFIPTNGKGFFLQKLSTLFESLFLISEAVTYTSEKQFSNIELILTSGN